MRLVIAELPTSHIADKCAEYEHYVCVKIVYFVIVPIQKECETLSNAFFVYNHNKS